MPIGLYLDTRRITGNPETMRQFYTDPLGRLTYPAALVAGLLDIEVTEPVGCPVTVIAASGDPLFPLDYTRQLFEKIDAPAKELMVVDAAEHLIFTESLDLVLEPLLGKLMAQSLSKVKRGPDTTPSAPHGGWMYALRMGFFDRFRSGPPGPHGPAEVGLFRMSYEAEDRASLTLELGDLPTEGVVEEAGEEPNGAFWEGVVHYTAPRIFRHLNFDSEGSMFAVEGERADLRQLRELLLPYVTDESAMRALLERAHGDGITLEGYGG